MFTWPIFTCTTVDFKKKFATVHVKWDQQCSRRRTYVSRTLDGRCWLVTKLGAQCNMVDFACSRVARSIGVSRYTCFARSAKFRPGYIFYLPFLSFFKLSKAISGSTGPIFTIFSPNGNYLRVCCQSGQVFPITQGTLPWQPILGKIGKWPSFSTLAF